MFEDSLLENRMKTRRGWTTVLSLVVQSLLVGVLVLIPLIYTDALPSRELATFLVAPAPPPPPPPPPAAEAKPVRVARHVESEIVAGKLRTPTRIPSKVAMIKEEAPPPPAAEVAGVIGGVPGGVLGSVPKVIHVPKPAPPKIVRVSQGVTEGLLVRKVVPVYPPMARQAHVQGAVKLQAVIGTDGTIQNLRLLSGHPLLARAAIDAVEDWRFKPYMLNGHPVEVETEITVNFSLG